MKKDQIAENEGHVVQVRPLARRPTPDGDLPALDDDWIIDRVDDKGVYLRNLRTGHSPLLGYDQIHSYLSNPIRDVGERKHGFLQLRIQLILHPDRVCVAPLQPGKWESADSQLNQNEPFRIPNILDPELKRIQAYYRERGEKSFLPLMEERDIRLASGHRIAYFPGTLREVWVGYSGGRFYHLLMLKP